MKNFKQFLEDIGGGYVASPLPVNNISGGSYEGTGVGPKGEPGGTKAIMNKMIRRKKPNVDSKLSP